MLMSKEQIEADAKLCATHGDESDCRFKPGTPGHAIWMSAYREQGARDADNADVSYEMSFR